MIHLKQKRKISLAFLSGFDMSKLEIGIPVLNSENVKLDLRNIGDAVIPNPTFGITCKKNANGYTYADKTAEKENRYTHTTCFLPFGNLNACEVLVDHSRDCYPKIDVPPTNIMLSLLENNSQDRFIIADFAQLRQPDVIKTAINMFLEIFGECYIYDDNQHIQKDIPRRFYNWEFLPPDKKPSEYTKSMLASTTPSKKQFIIERLEKIESFNPILAGCGTNGFYGYYAYLFNKTCFFECAFYGNATYIVPAEIWEDLSRKTKQELTSGNLLMAKITHDSNWFTNIEDSFSKYEKE